MIKRTYLIENIIWPDRVWYPSQSVYVTVEGEEDYFEYEMYWTELVENKLKSQFGFVPKNYVGKEIKK